MAVATLLPELVTSIAAVRRGALTLAVSDIVGGNFFDVLFVAAADRYGSPEDLQTLLELIQTRSAEFASWSRTLGGRIFAEKPKRLAPRFKAYWKAWRRQQPSTKNMLPEEMFAGA